MDEIKVINKFLTKLAYDKSSLDLKDDVFFNKKNNLVISTDTYVEGVHFIDFKKPKLVIKKILRSSISDLFCKGVKPKYYFISAAGNNLLFNKNVLKKITNSLKEEQRKYKIILAGGDTVYSKKITITITSVGFAKKVIYRKKSLINDDIYVSGNLGDSFVGLSILKKKQNTKDNNYFISKYYKPDLPHNILSCLNYYASSSIDISDGLFIDLDRLINRKKVSFLIYLDLVPISKKLKSLLSSKKLKKINFVSKGDDYQILFTSPKKFRNQINKFSKDNRIRITRIGKILNHKSKSKIIDGTSKEILAKNKGYLHEFWWS